MQVCTEHLFINIQMLSPGSTHDNSDETVVKEVSFFAQRQHSWIVGDAAVRRCQPGYPTYVADVTSPEMELVNGCVYKKYILWEKIDKSTLYSFFRDETETSWLVRPVEKYTNWIRERPAVDSGNGSDAGSGMDVDVETGNAAPVKSTPPINAAPQARHFFIVNESAYFLDIAVEYIRSRMLPGSNQEKSEVRYYCSDPRVTSESGRVVGIDIGEDRYPLVRVVAVRSGGSIAKRAEFFTERTCSWLVTDECIVRAANGNPARLSSWTSVTYSNDEVAPGAFHGGAGSLDEKWKNANLYKRHNWVHAE